MEGQVLFLYNGSDPSVMIELALAITNQSGKPHDYQLQLTPTEDGRFNAHSFSKHSPLEHLSLKTMLSTIEVYHPSNIIGQSSLRGDGSSIGACLLNLYREEPQRYTLIIQALQVCIPYFEDFIFETRSAGEAEQVEIRWRQKGSDIPMSLYTLSEASLRFITLATALARPTRPSLLIIDEPELGLHPTTISVLAELIQGVATQTQILIATQSSILIDQFGVEDIILVTPTEEGSTFKRLKEADYSLWLEDYSLGELWIKNILS